MRNEDVLAKERSQDKFVFNRTLQHFYAKKLVCSCMVGPSLSPVRLSHEWGGALFTLWREEAMLDRLRVASSE